MKELVVIIALAAAGCYDTVSSNHATRAAAKQDIERGWIPSVLPASAVQIRESHDLDTNTGHGTFGFGASDAEQFRATLVPLPPDHPLRAHRVLRSELGRRGYAFYRYEDFDVAVNWNRRVGEFWLVGKGSASIGT